MCTYLCISRLVHLRHACNGRGPRRHVAEPSQLELHPGGPAEARTGNEKGTMGSKVVLEGE